MNCITLESTNPFFNLAIEEILLKESTEEYLILGINSQSVIIGKHQPAHREVNTRYVTENNIPVIRRISGGGTVFHDEGNLNFTFIRSCEAGKQVDFRKYTKPVIGFLATLGVDAKFEGKNDLKVDGYKISGNAEHVHRNRVLHHGTLLFDSSLNALGKSLRKDKSSYSSRGVESNPSSVTNLEGGDEKNTGIHEFRSAMMNYFLEIMPDAEKYEPSRSEIEKAHHLANSKYMTWEWNWAYGPEYHFSSNFDILENRVSCDIMLRME